MSKLRILVICLANANSDPRPNRMIKCLKNEYVVTAASSARYDDPEIKSILLEGKTKSFGKKLKRLMLNLVGSYDALYSDDIYLSLIENLKCEDYSIIVAHDLIFLPILKKYKKNAKVIFDAREYYPRQFEDKILWKLIHGKKYRYLCRNYLKVAETCVTVSNGIAKEYQKEYGITCDILYSWPDYYDLRPTPINSSKIRIIHHGNAFPSRKIEKMIELMSYVDGRYELDLMLVNKDKKYYKKLQQLASKIVNVNIINPVPFSDIVPFTNQYDIGLYLTEPGNFNVRHMLPNKFFEFIQSRLMVAIGPSIEMKSLVNKYDLGLVAEDFNPKSLANLLNKLDVSQIEKFKNNSDKLAHQFNAPQNCDYIRGLISNMLNCSRVN